MRGSGERPGMMFSYVSCDGQKRSNETHRSLTDPDVCCRCGIASAQVAEVYTPGIPTDGMRCGKQN
jgi:hypothetical protein